MGQGGGEGVDGKQWSVDRVNNHVSSPPFFFLNDKQVEATWGGGG